MCLFCIYLTMTSNTKAHVGSQPNITVLVDILSTLKPYFCEGISEYSLLQLLQQPPYCIFDQSALKDNLTLFRSHFVLFHGLYVLRQQWRTDQTGELDIHTTSICLKPYELKQGVVEDDPLGRYYLDLNQIESTSEQDVETLLDDFWLKMGGFSPYVLTQESMAACYETLGLNSDQIGCLSLLEVKKHYRKQLHLIHPDKGGSEEQAKALVQAYQCIVQHMNKAC